MNGAAAFKASEKYNRRAKDEGWPSLCDPSLSFRHSDLADLLSLWSDLSKCNGLLRRRDISPRTMKQHLPDIAIYERVEDDPMRYRVRLMGTAIAKVMGDLSGRFIDDAVPVQVLPRWLAALNAVLEARAPLRFIGRSDTCNRSYLVGEYFEAPLLDDDGALTMIFAAGQYSAQKWADAASAEANRNLTDITTVA